MKQTQQTAQHTAGPLTIDTDSDGAAAEGTFENLNLIIESRSAESHIAFVFDDQHTNARLLTAAYNSYDKHCGARAVECAEDDLLGELLEVCRAAHHALRSYQYGNTATKLAEQTADRIEAAIAKATTD